MTQQSTPSTPVLDPSGAEAAAPKAPKQKSPEKKKKNKKLIKTIVIAVVVVALVAAAAFGIWYLVFREKPAEGLGEPIYDYASYGSITSMVNGYGTANAKDSATITLSQAGTVESVFVSVGQPVMEGDPLYVIHSTAAEDAVKEAQEALEKQQATMDELNKQMADLQKSRSDLTIVAPHAGKLTEVADIKVGDPLADGSTIARIVDDTRLKLSLYYSYAYENDIYVGQSASISIPATMTTHAATVEKINKVRRITPEGGVTFEVIFAMDNPGTLTSGMSASAELTDGAGGPIYPYETGTLDYYQTTTVATKAAGPVEQVIDLMNYADVEAGQVLLVQGTNTVDEQIRAKQEQIAAAQVTYENNIKAVETAQKNLENFSAVSPITGTVVALNLTEGMDVAEGSTAVTIADNSVMTVNISVDDRNRQYIDTGMELTLNDWYGNSYIGIVDTIAVIGENQNGVTVYPAVVRVDNPSGTLMGGYGLDYSFVAAQSDGCLTVPIADVRYYTPEGADKPQAVVYLKLQDGQQEPENVLDKTLLPADMQEEIPKGCVVVPIEVGLNDDSFVEVLSGLNEGDMVYNNTPKEEGYWGRRASASVKAG